MAWQFSHEMTTTLIVCIILLLFCALFAMSEVAFFALRQEDLDELKKENKGRAALTLKLLDDEDRLLFTIITANIICHVLFALFAYSFNDSILHFNAHPFLEKIVNAIIIIVVILIFGETIPRVIASKHSLGISLNMSIPLILFYYILTPLSFLSVSSLSYLKRKIGIFKPNIIDELSDFLEQTEDDLNEDEKILKGVVNFSNIAVNAIMCPRTDITAVEYNSSYKDVISNIIESGFSRIPIYATTFDNIKGILYAQDILPYIDKPNNFRWQELLRSPYFVPETKKINVLLKELQTKKIHMAIVIDEYGGTSGLVTLEDILEEIVGEIIDESDEDEILYRKIDDNTYVFKGKVLLDDFIETLKLEEDPFEYVRGESETLAGLILQLTGVMPSVKQVVKFENFEFIIESTDARRITQVRVKINDGQKENQKESEDKKDEESK